MRSPAPDHRPPAAPQDAPAAMRSPSTGSPMHLVEVEPTAYTLRGLSLTVGGPAWECPDTQQRYSTPEQVNAVLAQVHQLWRKHYGIGRAALQQRRLDLGLSAAQASALLGFGINQYSKYEQTDKVPSKANAVLLQLLMTDTGIAALLESEAARQALKPAARRRLQQHVAALAPVPSSSRPTITATGSDVAGGSVGSLSELSSRERQRVVRNEAPEQGQALQELLVKQQFLASQGGDYSYAMAA